MNFSAMKSKRQAASLLFAALTLNSQAVTVGTPLGSRTTDPGTGVQWDNVLNVVGTSGSAVYLGGGWVLTAEHVFNDGSATTSSVSFGGVTYAADPTQIYDLTNVGLGALATDHPDLKLYRLTETLPLPTITISTSNLVGESVTMIGFGGGKSWGNNEIEAVALLGNLNEGNGDTDQRTSVYFSTDYDLGVAGEGQGAVGDSGGGVFSLNAGTWELAGIMSAVNTVAEPDLTFSVDLTFYRSEINTIISTQGSAVPEPSAFALLSLASLFVLRRRR